MFHHVVFLVCSGQQYVVEWLDLLSLSDLETDNFCEVNVKWKNTVWICILSKISHKSNTGILGAVGSRLAWIDIGETGSTGAHLTAALRRHTVRRC